MNTTLNFINPRIIAFFGKPIRNKHYLGMTLETLIEKRVTLLTAKGYPTESFSKDWYWDNKLHQNVYNDILTGLGSVYVILDLHKDEAEERPLVYFAEHPHVDGYMMSKVCEIVDTILIGYHNSWVDKNVIDALRWSRELGRTFTVDFITGQIENK